MPVPDPSSSPSSTSATRERLLADAAAGLLAANPDASSLGLSRELLQSLHYVLEHEHPGSWAAAMDRIGCDCGRQIAAGHDAAQKQAGRPLLGERPLETSPAVLQDQFAAHGWGRLAVDVSAAEEYALIVARLDGSFFAAAVPEATPFADPIVAGLLRGFFEYITGQSLASAELACACQGAAQCLFVVTTPDRLAEIAPLVGRDSAEAILHRLKT